MTVVSSTVGRLVGQTKHRWLGPLGVYAACCVVVMCSMLAFHLSGAGGQSPDDVAGSYSLVDGDGRTVTDRSFADRYKLVTFGYTSCPDACPLTLSRIAGALDELGQVADRVAVLFITIDPARDTPERVARYAALFSRRIVGLSGTARQVAVAMKDYGIVASRHGGSGDDFYLIDHTHTVFLMSPDGRFRGTIDPDATADIMARQLSEELR